MQTKSIMVSHHHTTWLPEADTGIGIAMLSALIFMALFFKPTQVVDVRESQSIKLPVIEKMEIIPVAPKPNLKPKVDFLTHGIFSPELMQQLNRVLVKADDIIQAAEEQSARIKTEETYLQ